MNRETAESGIENHCDRDLASFFRRCWEESPDQAFMARMVFNEDGTPADFVLLDLNPAFAKEMGRTLDQVAGRKFSELCPHYDPDWVRKCGEVVRSGQTLASVEHNPELDLWYEVRVYQLDTANEFSAMFRNITEAKRAQQALEESERKYRELVKYAPTGIYEIDFRNRRFLSVNDAMCEVTGYSREELLAMNPFDLMDDRSKLLFQTRLKQWLSGEEPDENVDYVIITKDGRQIWAELYNSFTVDEHCQPLGATVISHDITERKQAEEKVRDAAQLMEYQNRKLNAVIQSLPHGLVIYDKDANPIFYNEQSLKAYNKSIENKDIPMDHRVQAMRPMHREGGRATTEEMPIMRALKGEVVRDLEMSYISRSGERLWVSSTTAPIINGDGEINEAVATYVDITERKKAEEELQNYRLHLEALVQERTREVEEAVRLRIDILESISDSFVAFDENLCYTYVNKAVADLMGYSPDEMIGKSFEELIPEPNPIALENYRQVLSEKIPKHFEAYSEQLKIWTEIRVYPYNRGISIYFKDITERKRIENEMARLDRLNLIGEMAAGIGHEIRNPMTSVRGFLQMLSTNPKYHEEADFFELMIEELDRANSIITEYLGMAKDKRVDLQPRSLDYLVTALYPMIMSDANLRGINLRLDLNNPPEPLIDVNEIRQLILNMVRNGMEAMGEQGNLTIGTRLAEDEIVLYVKDEGHGLHPDVAEKLGTPFFTTKANGTGLGLAVCYSIAARHHAKLDYETSPEGTTFYVRFPVESGQSLSEVENNGSGGGGQRFE